MNDPQADPAVDIGSLQRRLERQRKARLEAESIAEKALRQAHQKHEALVSETARRERLEREHQAAFKAEQLRVVQVTMRTVQDVVNNCLNQLQLLRMEAEGQVADDTLRHFDDVIEDTVVKMQALGDLQVFAEKQMAVGLGLDVDWLRTD